MYPTDGRLILIIFFKRHLHGFEESNVTRKNITRAAQESKTFRNLNRPRENITY